jgi:hypothetical protein
VEFSKRENNALTSGPVIFKSLIKLHDCQIHSSLTMVFFLVINECPHDCYCTYTFVHFENMLQLGYGCKQT